jgi:hypothetical protein
VVASARAGVVAAARVTTRDEMLTLVPEMQPALDPWEKDLKP